MGQVLPKSVTFLDSLANGTCKLSRKSILLFKFYLFLSIFASSGCHVYVIVEYTFRSNGAIMNFSYLIHHLMEFMIIFLSSGHVTTDEVLIQLDQASQMQIKKYLNFATWSVFAFSVSWFVMFVIHAASESTNHLMMFMFGFDSSGFDRTIEFFFIFVSVNDCISLVLISCYLITRYISLIYALLLFARKNVLLVDTFVSKYDSIYPKEVMFGRIEELYLTYRELVPRINSAYGKVPLWYLTVVYTNIIFTGTFLVIFHGKVATSELLCGSFFALSVFFIIAYSMIYLCDSSYTWMEKFRQKGLHLVNLHLKRSKRWDPKCECLANTLRGLPLLKLKAGQVYDMEPSIVISLIASAIPMTVMMVSLIREM